ncbi:MAG TPA: methyltransferase domain-containing protein [Terriglobia bacterium]|nr:methyltransferase domain-containing protein [Terriglobia bacterium]
MRNEEVISTAEFDSYAEKYEELLAHSIKLSGEKPEYFAAYKADYLARLAPQDIRRVLDYGCGIGMLTNQLRLRFPDAQVDGFDPSPGSLARIDSSLLT